MSELVTIEELKKMKEKIQNNTATDLDYERIVETFPTLKEDSSIHQEDHSNTNAKEDSFQKSMTNASYPSLLDKNAGFSNVMYLAAMSLVFEICFLTLAFFIYK
jgi:hypothetical protein